MPSTASSSSRIVRTILKAFAVYATGFLVMFSCQTAGYAAGQEESFDRAGYGTLPYDVSTFVGTSRDMPDTAEESASFYRNRLTGEAQALYDSCLSAISEMKPDIVAPAGTTSSGVKVVFRYIAKDHPELFWFAGTGLVEFAPGPDAGVNVIRFDYRYSPEEKQQVAAEFDERLRQLEYRAGLAAGNGEQHSVNLAVLNGIADTCSYSVDAPRGAYPDGAVLDGEAFCAGYSKVAVLALRNLGIPAVYVTGTADGPGGSQEHAWIFVKLDDGIWWCDPTWHDTARPMAWPDERKWAGTRWMEFSETHTVDCDWAFK